MNKDGVFCKKLYSYIAKKLNSTSCLVLNANTEILKPILKSIGSQIRTQNRGDNLAAAFCIAKRCFAQDGKRGLI